MTPLEQARAVYDREPCARSFDEDLFWHLERGIVISRPDLFLMVRRVRMCWPELMLKNPQVVAADGNCLHIWLCAGDMRLAPPLLGLSGTIDWATYERQNRIRLVFAKSLLAKLGWDPQAFPWIASSPPKAPTGPQD